MSRVAPRVQRPQPAPVQAKLEVTAVNDPLEVEADRTADQVVASIQSGAVAAAMASRRVDHVGRAQDDDALQGVRIARSAPEEELVQGHRIARVEEEDVLQGNRIARVEEEEPLQGKRIARSAPEEELPVQGQRIARASEQDAGLGPEGGAVSGELEREVDAASGGTAMPGDLRSTMEAGFGADFGSVKLHVNSPVAPKLGALAFARGTDVHFAPGQFDPSSAGGQHLIAHELTHVVQQGGAAARTMPEDKGGGPAAEGEEKTGGPSAGGGSSAGGPELKRAAAAQPTRR